MTNMRLIVDNAHDSAILSADQEAMPIANTQGGKGVLREYPHRTTDATVQGWGAVFPEKTIEGIVISRANFTQAATLTAVLKLAAVTQDTIVIPANGTDTWVKWIDATQADEIQFTVDDTANPDGYLQFVQAIYGPKLEVETNVDLGPKLIYREDVEHIRTAGQSLRSEGTRLQYRELDIKLSWIDATERPDFTDALLASGQASPAFISLYPEMGGRLEADHQFVAKRTSDLSMDRGFISYWQTGITFQEA